MHAREANPKSRKRKATDDQDTDALAMRAPEISSQELPSLLPSSSTANSNPNCLNVGTDTPSEGVKKGSEQSGKKARQQNKGTLAQLVRIAPRQFDELMLRGCRPFDDKRVSFDRQAKKRMIEATELYAHWLLHTSAACAGERGLNGDSTSFPKRTKNHACSEEKIEKPRHTLALQDVNRAASLLSNIPRIESILTEQHVKTLTVSEAFLHRNTDFNKSTLGVNQFLLDAAEDD